MDVHHARRRVGELVRCTHLLLLRLHERHVSQATWRFRITAVSCVSIVPCEAPVALVCLEFSQDFVRQRRPSRIRPVAEIAVRERHECQISLGIDPQKRP